MALTPSQIISYISKAQRAQEAGMLAIVDGKRTGRKGDSLYFPMRFLSAGVDVLTSNHGLTNLQVEIIIQEMIEQGNLNDFSGDPIPYLTTYVVLPGTGGGITSITVGGLNPLFTTSVLNATTAPVVSFTKISQSQNLVYASPNGSSGVPSFRALTSADLPPAGLDTQVQFNDNGVFGATAGFTFNKVTNLVTNTGGGVVITQGTLTTTNKPYLSHSATWNDAAVDFNGFISNINNTNSGGGSTLFDVQLNSNTMFKIDRFGDVLLSNGAFNWSSGDHTLNITTISNGRTPLTLQGYASTGSNSSASLIAMTGTWNTSGSPTALHVDMTNTASGVDTAFLYFKVGSTKVFNVSKNGSLSINTNATPTASLDIIGQGSTSSTYGLKINNSTGSSSTLVVRDDARVGIGTLSPLSLFHVQGVSYHTGDIFVNPTGPSFTNTGPILTYGVDLLGHNASKFIGGGGGEMIFNLYDATRDMSWQIGVGTNGIEHMRLTNAGLFGIGTIITGLAPSARLHVVGLGADSATYAFKAMNSSSELLLSLKDDGIINMARFVTNTTYANNAAAIAGGLVVGDLYITGANPDYIAVVH